MKRSEIRGHDLIFGGGRKITPDRDLIFEAVESGQYPVCTDSSSLKRSRRNCLERANRCVYCGVRFCRREGFIRSRARP